MGTQQLLQLVLAATIVAIAVVVGIGAFDSSAAQANEDAVIQDLQQLVFYARKHYRTPPILGGGGGSFRNFTMPAGLAETINGTYQHIKKSHNADHIHFEGTGKEIGMDGVNPIRIELRITIDKIEFKRLN